MQYWQSLSRPRCYKYSKTNLKLMMIASSTMLTIRTDGGAIANVKISRLSSPIHGKGTRCFLCHWLLLNPRPNSPQTQIKGKTRKVKVKGTYSSANADLSCVLISSKTVINIIRGTGTVVCSWLIVKFNIWIRIARSTMRSGAKNFAKYQETMQVWQIR